MCSDRAASTGDRAPPVAAATSAVGSRQWTALAGLLAAVPMGAFLRAFTPLLPPVTGTGGVVAGTVVWTVHLALGAVLAFGYVALVARLPVETYQGRHRGRVALGLCYGTALWATVGAVALPLTAAAVGLPAPAVPFWSPPALAAHLLYGGVLGVLATPE